MKHTRRLAFVSAFIFVIASLTSPLAKANDDQNKQPPKTETAAVACEALLGDSIPIAWVQRMMKEGQTDNPQYQRLRELVQRAGLASVTLNLALVKKHNTDYTVELPSGEMTDQAQSGRCWIFAGLNVLRSKMISEGKIGPDFKFSESYLHFFSMLEKSNRYLESIIEIGTKKKAKEAGKKLSMKELKNALEPGISDGGWYEYFMFLVTKYGVVPKDAMPETASSVNTGQLLNELKNFLAGSAAEILVASETISKARKEGKTITDADVSKILATLKEKQMLGIWRILATHLGDPPSEFIYRANGEPELKDGVVRTPAKFARLTPQQFAKDIVEFNADDYVVMASFPTKPEGKVYEVPKSAIGVGDSGAPSFDLRFMNVSTKRLEELTLASIEGGQAVWFAADMRADIHHESGIMHPNIYVRDAVYDMPAEQRAPVLPRPMAVLFGISGANHAMTFVGFDKPFEKAPVIKFKVENSWGDEVGNGGFYAMYHPWFHRNVYQVIVHKKFLTEAERAMWEKKDAAVKLDGEEDL